MVEKKKIVEVRLGACHRINLKIYDDAVNNPPVRKDMLEEGEQVDHEEFLEDCGTLRGILDTLQIYNWAKTKARNVNEGNIISIIKKVD